MKLDLQIKKYVTDELSWDPSIDAAAVGVAVNDGVVTLSGHLPSPAEKRAAERVSGVRAVVIKLEVRPAGVHSDEAIGTAARDALQWHARVPSEAVKVRVEKGWVTLSGEVDWGYQRRVAEQTVSELRGVIGVINHIKLKERVAPPDIVQRIQAALHRYADREAKHIDVVVENGTVTLSGRVDSFAERNAVLGAAWAAPGVASVVDHLHLV
uniref:BON domain-containing protein n=1 Tax=Cupriavidus necator TaxID=106590 RepID=UPI003F497941